MSPLGLHLPRPALHFPNAADSGTNGFTGQRSACGFQGPPAWANTELTR